MKKMVICCCQSFSLCPDKEFWLPGFSVVCKQKKEHDMTKTMYNAVANTYIYEIDYIFPKLIYLQLLVTHYMLMNLNNTQLYES